MLKGVFLIIITAFIFLGTASYFYFQEEISEIPAKYQATNQNQKNISINGQNLVVEIADEAYEQTRGLSRRESLAENSGMLFVFPQPSKPGFWMKEMKFSLDLIWIDQDSAIIEITKDTAPETYPQIFYPPSPILYVLEVNAGWSDRNNIKPGNKMIAY